MLTKLLARKNIKIHIVGLFHKVSDDVGSLYQLDQGESSLSARAKVLYPGGSIGYHVDLLDQLVGELSNLLLRPDSTAATGSCVNNQMMSPCHYYISSIIFPEGSANFAQPVLKNFSSFSMPMPWRPSASAARMALKDPAVGSRTVPPSGQ